jgi:hypothetical protein
VTMASSNADSSLSSRLRMLRRSSGPNSNVVNLVLRLSGPASIVLVTIVPLSTSANETVPANLKGAREERVASETGGSNPTTSSTIGSARQCGRYSQVNVDPTRISGSSSRAETTPVTHLGMLATSETKENTSALGRGITIEAERFISCSGR